MNNKRIQSFVQLALLTGVLIFANILGCNFHGLLDLTEENRYTLSRPTKNLIGEVKDVMYVKVMLEGEFPAGFKRLQTATRELLDDLRSVNGNIEYSFEDPNQGTVQEINARRKQFAEDGMVPMQLVEKTKGETSRKLVYPYAIINYGGRSIPINLLENQGSDNEQASLNKSIATLEYKFSNGMQKVMYDKHPKLFFTDGHGELDRMRTYDLEYSLHQRGFVTDRIVLDSFANIKPDVSILVVAKPKTAFSEKDKFKIDQFVMNGGKVLWLIDRLSADLDSLQMTSRYMPFDYPLNLEDQFFKYGFRVQPNLVLDMKSAKIPMRVGQQGGGPQFQMYDWFYHPLSSPRSNHAIVKNMSEVWLQFPSTVDTTVKTKTNVKKTILLTSSDNARVQNLPVEINFEILRYDADKSKFDKKEIPLAVLLEGSFPSLYENRVNEEMSNTLKGMGQEFKLRSPNTKMIIVSDGDIAANGYDKKNQTPTPLGQNIFMQRTFANKDFLMNSIEYLLDDNGLIETRAKEVKLRLLDKVRTEQEKGFWQFVNIGLPLIILAIFGLIFNYLRKKRYTA